MRFACSLALAMCALGALVMQVRADDKEVTLKGTVLCARCVLKETAKCTTAIVVKGSTADVIGKGKVHFYDATRKIEKGQPDFDALSAGGRYVPRVQLCPSALATGSAVVPTWPTSSASPPRAGPPKSARPVGITSCCWGRRGPARRCWPSGSRPSCPPWTVPLRSKSPRSIPWQGPCPRAAR